MIAGVVDAQLLANSLPKPVCAECRQPLKVNEVVVTFSQGPKVFVHPQLFVHRRHFDEELATAPTDADVVDAAVSEVVAEYRATGRTAVDVLLDA